MEEHRGLAQLGLGHRPGQKKTDFNRQRMLLVEMLVVNRGPVRVLRRLLMENRAFDRLWGGRAIAYIRPHQSPRGSVTDSKLNE